MITGETKKALVDLCKDFGCSGLSLNCPGNPNCEILKKIINGIVSQTIDKNKNV